MGDGKDDDNDDDEDNDSNDGDARWENIDISRNEPEGAQVNKPTVGGLALLSFDTGRRSR